MNNPSGTYTDLSFLTAFSGGDTGFVKEMVVMFVQKMPVDLPQLKLLAENSEWAEVKSLAHKLKSSVNFMGIPGMKEKLQKLEDDTQAENIYPEQLLADINGVINICNKAVEELKAQFEIA